jgi:membrane-associated phospholipid phosphatase
MDPSSVWQIAWRRHRALLGLLVFGVALPWGVFLKASSEIREGEGFPGDHAIPRWLHDHATPGLDTLSLTMSRLGSPIPMSAFAVLILWFLWRHPPRRRASFFAAALGGAMTLNVIAKALLGRVRPAFWHSLAPETTPSFPSGHAMGSMALVLTLCLLLHHSRWRWLAWILGPLFVSGVGWSSMYLGVHYPSDVAAGWIASTAWVLSVYFLFFRYLQASERAREREPSARPASIS